MVSNEEKDEFRGFDYDEAPRWGKGRREVKIDGTEEGLGWLERMMALLDRYPVYKLLKGLFMVVIISYVFYFSMNPSLTYELLMEEMDREHSELIAMRMENSPKVQAKCEDLMYRTDASRVLFLELHNNTENIVGMPFYYATASCEAIDDGVRPIANEFNEIKMSLFPFFATLSREGYWDGDVESMKNLDKSLYYRMKADDMTAGSFIVVQGTEKPCGILFLSFSDTTATPNFNLVRKEMNRTALSLGVLVEVGRRDD